MDKGSSSPEIGRYRANMEAVFKEPRVTYITYKSAPLVDEIFRGFTFEMIDPEYSSAPAQWIAWVRKHRLF